MAFDATHRGVRYILNQLYSVTDIIIIGSGSVITIVIAIAIVVIVIVVVIAPICY